MKQQLTVLSDSLSLTLAFLIAFFLRTSSIATTRFGILNYDPKLYLIAFITASLLLLMVFGGFKLYQVRTIELSARIFTILKALGTWTFITATLIYLTKLDFSRGIFFMTIGFTIIFICISRYLIFKRKQGQSKDGDIEMLIIGDGDRAQNIEKQVKDIHPHSICKKLNISDKSTYNLLISHQPTEIFIADETLPRDKILSIIADESLKHHSFRIILDTFRLATGEVRINDIDEIPSISPQSEPTTVYKLIKRATDIIIATTSIIIISPIWLLTIIIIKLDSNGPAHILQTRIGWNGKPFTIYKFRTMKNEVPLYEIAPRNGIDSRVTKIGKTLRRLSIDEIPQLLNILRGEMSLVGPRPEMPFIAHNYTEWQKFRLKAKPGLTGLWQILGRKDLPLHENLEYDFYYVTNQNLLLDFSIILKTVPAVLFGRGAY